MGCNQQAGQDRQAHTPQDTDEMRIHQRSLRSLNISALVTSGEFFIDDHGYLVSVANGTRYQLPSGPPEGRPKGPLRLIPVYAPTSSGRQLDRLNHYHPQLADSAVVASPELLSTQQTGAYNSSISSSSSFTEVSTDVLSSLDGGLGVAHVSLCLVASCLALLTNAALLTVSFWHLFTGRSKNQGRRSGPRTVGDNADSMEMTNVYGAKYRTAQNGLKQHATTIITSTAASTAITTNNGNSSSQHHAESNIAVNCSHERTPISSDSGELDLFSVKIGSFLLCILRC